MWVSESGEQRPSRNAKRGGGGWRRRERGGGGGGKEEEMRVSAWEEGKEKAVQSWRMLPCIPVWSSFKSFSHFAWTKRNQCKLRWGILRVSPHMQPCISHLLLLLFLVLLAHLVDLLESRCCRAQSLSWRERPTNCPRFEGDKHSATCALNYAYGCPLANIYLALEPTDWLGRHSDPLLILWAY